MSLDSGSSWEDALPTVATHPAAAPASTSPVAAPSAPASFPVVAPHAAPDGSGSLTNLSDEDYVKFTSGQAPPAAAPAKSWEDALPAVAAHPAALAEPADDKGKTTGAFANLAAGGNDAVAGMLGLPVDALTGAINLVPRGINALAGTNIPTIQNPIGGSESIKQGMGLVGANPDNVVAATPDQQIARSVGAGAASMALPMGVPGAIARVLPTAARAIQGIVGGGSVAANAARGAVMGAGGQLAANAVPAPYKPYADVGGQLAAGGLTGALEAAGRTLYGAGSNMASGAMAPLTSAGRAQLAARRLQGAATDPTAAAQAIDATGAPLVPGSDPTTFQASGDQGLGNLERAVSKNAPDQFLQRRNAQNAAQVGALESQAPTQAHADAAVNLFRQRLATMDGQNAAAETAAQQAYDAAKVAPATAPTAQIGAAQTAANALGGAIPAGADAQETALQGFGSAIRNPVVAAKAASAKNASRVWDAIDPDGTLATNVKPVKSAAAAIAKSMDPESTPMDADTSRIVAAARLLPDTLPFKRFAKFRTQLTNAIPDVRMSGAVGNRENVARLESLLSSVHEAMEPAIAAAEGEQSSIKKEYNQSNEPSQKENIFHRNTSGEADNGAGYMMYSNNEDRVAHYGKNHFILNLNKIPRHEIVNASTDEFQDLVRSALKKHAEMFDNSDENYSDSDISPKDIVDSAGVWDNPELVDTIYNDVLKPNGWTVVKTSDGVISFDPEHATKTNHQNDYYQSGISSPAVSSGGRSDGEQPVNWDQDAAARYAAARAATRQHHETFSDAPGVGAILKPGRFEGDLDLVASRVPSTIFSGAGQAEKIQAYLKAGGDRKALLDYAAFDLKRNATRADGLIDPAKAATWAKNHSEALTVLPEMNAAIDGTVGATRATDFAAAAAKTARDTAETDAQAKLRQATAQRTEQRRAFEKSAIGQLVGDADPARVVGRILSGESSAADMRQLAQATAGNPAARAGLQRAVVDHMMERIKTNQAAGQTGTDLLKSDVFQTWLRTREPALRTIFSPAQIDSMKNVAADLKRNSTSVSGTKLPGGSNTAQDLAAGEKLTHGKHSMLGQMIGAELIGEFAHGAAETVIPGSGIIAHAIGTGTSIGALALNAMRDAGMQKVDDLVTQAMLHPGLAKTLLMMPTKQAAPNALAIFKQQMKGMAATTAARSLSRAVQ